MSIRTRATLPRPARLVLATLVGVATLTACDSGPTDGSGALIGTWEFYETASRTLVTTEADVSYISPYHPAEGTITVSGLDVPALRYLGPLALPGSECASGCRPRIEIRSHPPSRFTAWHQRPTRSELILASVTSAFEAWTPSGNVDLNASSDYALTPTTLRLSPMPLRNSQGQPSGHVVQGTLDLPIRTLTAGEEAEIRPFEAGDPAGKDLTVRWTFDSDGTYEAAYESASTGAVYTIPGTWTWADGRVGITMDADAESGATTSHEVRVEGGDLVLTASSPMQEFEFESLENTLRLPSETITEARTEERQTARRL